ASAQSLALRDAVQNASDAGIVIVAAAGNDGSDNDGGAPLYPCNYEAPNLICVAALDQRFELASFSNYGAKSVDIGAPGTNILSPWAGTSETQGFSVNDTGWSRGSGWLLDSLFDPLSLENVVVLSNPGTWPDGQYANNLDSRA